MSRQYDIDPATGVMKKANPVEPQVSNDVCQMLDSLAVFCKELDQIEAHNRDALIRWLVDYYQVNL